MELLLADAYFNFSPKTLGQPSHCQADAMASHTEKCFKSRCSLLRIMGTISDSYFIPVFVPWRSRAADGRPSLAALSISVW